MRIAHCIVTVYQACCGAFTGAVGACYVYLAGWKEILDSVL